MARAARSVFVYLPNGVNTIDFQVETAGADYTFSKSLQPLAKHKANITPISGLYHPHGLGHHHGCSSIWLTGAKLGPAEWNTISVDQLMAQVTARHTRFTSIELSNQGAHADVQRRRNRPPAARQPGGGLPRAVRRAGRRGGEVAAGAGAARQRPRRRPRGGQRPERQPRQ